MSPYTPLYPDSGVCKCLLVRVSMYVCIWLCWRGGVGKVLFLFVPGLGIVGEAEPWSKVD